jgi:class 3 adenylate cyclase
VTERRSAQHARQQALNQLKAAIVTLDPPLRAQLERRTPATLARSELLQRRQLAPLQRLARRILLLDNDLIETDRELAELTRALCPQLLRQPGVGPICAAQLLVSTADPHRIRYRGTEVDTAGDGFFCRFDGPARAIACARRIVDGAGELGLQVRAGIHTGECELVGEKVAGISVVTGARISSLAASGEVLVSSTVKDLVAGSGFAFEDRGEHELKGVPGTWTLYAVASSAEGTSY